MSSLSRAPEPREPAPAPAPLLEAEDARLAVDDVTAVEHLTFRSTGSRIVVAGDSAPLMAALLGVARAREAPDPGGLEPPGAVDVVGGALRLRGADLATGAHRPAIGVVPYEPPRPVGFTGLDHAIWAARLAGCTPRDARELAQAAFTRLGQRPLAARLVAQLDPVERRVLALAAGTVTDPPVLVVDLPLAGVPPPVDRYLGDVLFRASEGRASIVSVARTDAAAPEGALLRDASDVLYFTGPTAFAAAPSTFRSRGRLFLVAVPRAADALRRALALRDVALEGGPLWFTLSLPAGEGTRLLFAASAEARAPIVELRPLS